MTGRRDQIRVPARPPADVLADVLAQERRLVEELRRALRRQADGIAAGDDDALDLATRKVARLRLTLDEARRCRASLLWMLTGVPAIPLETLELWFDPPLPDEVVAARDAVQRATALLESEDEGNRLALEHGAETAMLQQFLSFGGGPGQELHDEPRAGR